MKYSVGRRRLALEESLNPFVNFIVLLVCDAFGTGHAGTGKRLRCSVAFASEAGWVAANANPADHRKGECCGTGCCGAARLKPSKSGTSMAACLRQNDLQAHCRPLLLSRESA
jgi:hypothetical protein